jgi:hypothetical protein
MQFTQTKLVLYKNFTKILPPSMNNTIHFKAKLILILNYSFVFRVTYTRCRVDTIDSPDDGKLAARNM